MNYRRVILCVLIAFLVCFLAASSHLQAEDQIDGKAIFESKCSKCHPLSVPLSKDKDLKKWQATISRMSQKQNSEIDSKEAEIIALYLNSMSGQ